jgi:hypothetical protein
MGSNGDAVALDKFPRNLISGCIHDIPSMKRQGGFHYRPWDTRAVRGLKSSGETVFDLVIGYRKGGLLLNASLARHEGIS